MKTKITIAFSCPGKTAQLIDEYASHLGISRSACITMMCNAFIASNAGDLLNISDLRKEAFDRVQSPSPLSGT